MPQGTRGEGRGVPCDPRRHTTSQAGGSKKEAAASEAIEVTAATPLVAYAPHLMILLIEVGMTRVVGRECSIVAPGIERKQKA